MAASRSTAPRPVVTRADRRAARGSRLRPRDREYLHKVSEAAFANPYGAERERLDPALVGASGTDTLADTFTPRMLAQLEARLRAMFGEGPPVLSELPDHDRVLMENAICFETFHRHLGDLNAHIEAQERAQSEPLPVPFARALLGHLTTLGLSAERARRIFELFYQMARAHYFISRGLVGESRAMQGLRERLWEAVFTRDILRYEQYLWNRMEDFSTILVGETGTGKGAAAAAIGRSGFIPFDEKRGGFKQSFTDSFLPINLNEFPETLFESEIFGHQKGAFTGAIDHHRGVLSRCPEYGSVFFDEIGEATLPIQVKLLRVLQERLYTPVGAREPERFGGRILAATHRSLAELRAQGAMRDDFYYRLCANVIELPPLRERIGQQRTELPQLIAHVCARIVGSDAGSLAGEVAQQIERDLGPDYAFPGNVRELEQCVRRVLLSGSCSRDLRGERGAEGSLLAELSAGTLEAEELVARYCRLLYARTGSYVEVGRRTGLDRRTVKRYLQGLEP